LVHRLSIPQTIASISGKIHDLRDLLTQLKGRPISEITFQLDRFPLLVALACYLMTDDEPMVETLDQYVNHWRKIVSYTDGHHLRDKGLPSSKAYKTILHTLRAAWLDGLIHSREEEELLLNKLMKDKESLLKN
jgi:hypothetical protein